MKSKVKFVCRECGASFLKWSGKCEACGNWNTLDEEVISSDNAPKSLGGGGRKLPLFELGGKIEKTERQKTGIAELDRVCGGGLVAGSVILVGGDPGIGKSTLLLQALARLPDVVNRIYVSGEEAVDQIRLRACRLGLQNAGIQLTSAMNVRDILATLEEENPDVVVIDSIQTMFVDNLDSTPGSVGQVRACAMELIRLAKKKGFVLFLVGHVTKEGTLAGPRVLEHMVDTVLYFEGDRGHHFRILRAVKNRYGATDEIGVFEMTEKGLSEVANPSALFLAERRGHIAGNCVYAGVEGSRPLLVEVQALVSGCNGSFRRTVVGWDSGRLAMILAVLESRCGLNFASRDVFLNVAGGLKITEPAADMAVAMALISAISNKPVPADMAVFGEIGLSGELRNVGNIEARIKEASKLGFKKVLLPKLRKKISSDISLLEAGHLTALIELIAGGI